MGWRRIISNLRPLGTSNIAGNWIGIQKWLLNLWFCLIYFRYRRRKSRRSCRILSGTFFTDLHPKIKGLIFIYHQFILIMIILFKVITQEIFFTIIYALWFSPGVSFTYQHWGIHGMKLRVYLNSLISLPVWYFCLELKGFGVGKWLWWMAWFKKLYRIWMGDIYWLFWIRIKVGSFCRGFNMR